MPTFLAALALCCSVFQCLADRLCCTQGYDVSGNAVIVRGKESAGQYVEILDAKTGKTVGHKVYGCAD